MSKKDLLHEAEQHAISRDARITRMNTLHRALEYDPTIHLQTGIVPYRGRISLKYALLYSRAGPGGVIEGRIWTVKPPSERLKGIYLYGTLSGTYGVPDM